jgi:hypothetical protein
MILTARIRLCHGTLSAAEWKREIQDYLYRKMIFWSEIWLKEDDVFIKKSRILSEVIYNYDKETRGKP